MAAVGVDEAAALAADGLPTGAERVEVLRELVDITDRAAAGLAVVDLGPAEALVGPDRLGPGPVRRREDRAGGDVARHPRRRPGHGRRVRGAVGVPAPGRQQRGDAGGSGDGPVGGPAAPSRTARSSWATCARPRNCSFRAGSTTTTREFEALWGFTNPDEEWRNLILSPRYPASASLGRDMWAALGQPEIDGVLTVDIAALQAAAGGPGAGRRRRPAHLGRQRGPAAAARSVRRGRER